MIKYNPNKIEKKWQSIWEKEKTFGVDIDNEKEKFYCLIEFPFPSGEGLHVGHPRSYTALDAISRKKRMQGKNVLYPIGFDSFGLPTENYAMKTNTHPAIVTKKNIENYTRQLKSIGFSFDWDRMIITSNPEYYKWTQWIFLKLFEKGLAYKAKIDINFCVSCKVGLANEEVVNGECERCGSEVVRKEKEQWMLAITKYAQRLIDDLDDVDFIDRVKMQQINWIGRSEGSSIFFPIKEKNEKIEVFTTRPDTIYAATYMVVAPEHPLIDKYKNEINNYDVILEYRISAKNKSDFERTKLLKEKTGVKIDGLTAINPISKEEIPIFVADYVMIDYGTGAIMAVPAHDERDFEFAKLFNAKIIPVIDTKKDLPYTGEGIAINSDIINGLNTDEAKKEMIKYLEKNNIGKGKVEYKLRDWVFSRQRYWGDPIPIINCDKCGHIPLNEEDLPLTLPDLKEFTPSDDGSSPLSKSESWVNVKCPKCGGDAKRETDTMPQWAGSSWYFLRYIDPHNNKSLASKEAIDYWMGVDWYNGGMEHTTLHLLYSRFWYKFLYDIGVVNEKEPYMKRTSHGFILGEDSQKMSKSRGNVVNPDDIVENYGADTLRVYEMFIGDFEKAVNWSTAGVGGVKKFLERVWYAAEFIDESLKGYSKDLETIIHQTIKKVSSDYDSLKGNTAISQLMTLTNAYYKKKKISRDEYEILITLLNPAAPHITEELFEIIGNKNQISSIDWPMYDESKTVEDIIEIPVQFNGKVRFRFKCERGLSDEKIKEILFSLDEYKKQLEGKNLKKVIIIQDKLISVVVN